MLTTLPPTTTTTAATAGTVFSTNPKILSLQKRLYSRNPTRVVKLSNMCTPEELQDDEEWRDIALDVSTECGGDGVVNSIIIPRVNEGKDGVV